MNLLELLRRFRRHAVPGPARLSGVPVDIRAEREAELAGVFAALDPYARQAALIRAAGLDSAAATAQAAVSEAHAIVRSAERRTGEVAAEETATVLAALAEQDQQALAAAEIEAARVRRRAEAMIPATAQRIVDLALRPEGRSDSP